MRLGSPGFAAEITGHTLSVPGNDTNESWGVLADAHGVLAWFALADAASTIITLKQLGIRIHLLSGDGEAVVSATARTLQIDTWQSDALPETKLAYVKNLQSQGRIVAMVGDGINDAPVLAAAHILIAMGEGAEAAQAAADMVMLGKHLTPLAEGVALARKTRRIIYQNLAWALGYNVVAIPSAALGYVTPWIAGIGMSASSLLVVLNALRLAHVQACDP